VIALSCTVAQPLIVNFDSPIHILYLFNKKITKNKLYILCVSSAGIYLLENVNSYIYIFFKLI